MKIIHHLEFLEGQVQVMGRIADLPNPAEAARAYADQYEQEMLAEQQKD